MKKRLTIKDHKGESRLFRHRSMSAMLLVITLIFVLMGRLVYLQMIAHQRYSTLSQQNLLEILPTEPNRGLIFDRNGVLLAKNVPVFNLEIIPAHVKHLDKTLLALQKILPITENDILTFKRNLRQHRASQATPLLLNLDEQSLAIFYLNRYRFPGVRVQTKMFRTYPYGESFSHVVGYVGRINPKEMATLNAINYSASNYIGKTGIEKFYEQKLHGTVGAEQVEVDATGHIVRTIKRIRPIHGEDLYLTIDSRLQMYAEEALGDNNGAVIALQPSTGQILAMVTKPGFDPNIFVNGISHKNYKALLESPDHPLFNRAIRGQYAPASTIKPFIALAGLENEAVTTESRIFDPGWFRLPETKHIYHDWKLKGHGWINLTHAIMQSCDTFFYILAPKLGIQLIDDFLKKFGFGEATQVDMPEELPGLLPSPDWKQKVNKHKWYTGDTILTGIGQGFMLITPLQLASATASLAERGKQHQVHLLLKSEQPGQPAEYVPTIEKQNIELKHPEIWQTVISAMQGVVNDPRGTAVGFGRNPRYTVAAKTGTAQVYGKQRDEERSRLNIPKKLRNHHLFISFAPIDHPEIVLVVVIEHASHADRMARHILDFYFANCSKQDKASTDESVSHIQ